MPFVPGGNGFPHLPVDVVGHFAGFQEAQILSYRLTVGIAGKLGKLRVHVFDYAACVGYYDRDRALSDGGRELSQLFLCLVAQLHLVVEGHVKVTEADGDRRDGDDDRKGAGQGPLEPAGELRLFQ